MDGKKRKKVRASAAGEILDLSKDAVRDWANRPDCPFTVMRVGRANMVMFYEDEILAYLQARTTAPAQSKQ